MICFVHSKDPTNVGDLNCCPALYFNLTEKIEIFNITEIEKISNFIKNNNNCTVILGGGGLLGCDYFEKRINILINLKLTYNYKLIVWGVGLNIHTSIANKEEHKTKEQIYKKLYKKYTNDIVQTSDLIGVRDFGVGLRYLPCVSCVSDLFNEENYSSSIVNDVVYYSHKHHIDLSLSTKYPTLTNGEGKEFKKVIKFLSNSNIIITNSFHGAYWGLLLNKHVIINKPFSTRFLMFYPTNKISFCYDTNKIHEEINAIKLAHKTIDSNFTFLKDCRKRNKLFFNKIKKIINNK